MTDNTENLHKDHRKRVKKKFLANGFVKETPEHEMLELLLFYCIPVKDTNPLAHELLKRYGNLAGVLDAPVEELIQFKGITESNVVLLKLIVPLARVYNMNKQTVKDGFKNIDAVGEYFLDRYFGLNIETLSIMSLDGNGQLLSFDILAQGDLTSVGVSTRDIIQKALKTNATCVVMAHNHPGGIALPSGEDKAITKMVSVALSQIGVKLLDHLIIANGDYVSMMQSKEYEDLFL